MSLGKEYLSTVIKRLKYYKDLGEKTFDQLDEKDLHYLPTTESNSIAIIVQHLTGNMLSRFTNFLTEDGEKEWRQRDDEFETHAFSQEKLLQLWDQGWLTVFNALESLQPGDLEKTICIRSKPLTVIDAINRQLTHYSYHVGQIVMLGKIVMGSAWKSLSIPKGQSAQYNTGMKK